MITGIVEELVLLAKALDCKFPDDYVQKTIESMIKPGEKPSFMFADYQAKRPMEVETYLGSPIRLSKDARVHIPRVETLYAMLHYKNQVNLSTPAPEPSPPAQGPTSPILNPPPPRSSSVAGHHQPGRPMMNGSLPGGGARRAPSMNGQMGPPPPGMRRGPPPNGRMPNGHGPRMPPNGMPMRRQSVTENDLQEFSHLMLYDAEDGPNGMYGANGVDGSTTNLDM